MNARVPLEMLGACIQLRQVEDSDYPLLRAVYRDARRAELAVTAWTLAQKDAFCDAQFSLQDQHYRKHYPDAQFYAVEFQNQFVGRLYISNGARFLALMDIALLETWRGQGMGTTLLNWITDWADATERPIRLYVEPDNPARRLYERLGFVQHAVDGAYIQMWRGAPPVASPG